MQKYDICDVVAVVVALLWLLAVAILLIAPVMGAVLPKVMKT